jgi:hypothetical protein
MIIHTQFIFITLKVQQQELKMEYMDVKPDNYNGKILFCFTENFNGAYWQTTIAALTKKGFRVIVPDKMFWKSKTRSLQYTFNNWHKTQNKF